MTTTGPLTDSDLLILRCVDRGGLHIYQPELAYQVNRRGQSTNDLPERLADLEAHGLIESTTAWRLTDRGRDQLPDDHDHGTRAGTPVRWAPAAPTPPRRSSRGPK